jgi:hypothetical protein
LSSALESLKELKVPRALQCLGLTGRLLQPYV